MTCDASKQQETLQERAISEVERHDGIRPAAYYWDVNPGLIHMAVNGVDSPALRKLWNIRKTNRTRLCIDTDRTTIEQFDREREKRGLNREDYLLWLMGDKR